LCGDRLTPGPLAFAEALFDQAYAPVQTDAEHCADNAGDGNDHRSQHEDGDQAFQDRIPCSGASSSERRGDAPMISETADACGAMAQRFGGSG
jgi:hypothetical protein